MKSVVVSVLDTAMKAFGRPVFVPTIGVAVRSFTDEVNRKAEDNQMYRHPEDFQLWILAEFDEDQGVFEVPQDGKRMLVRGQDVFRKEA